MKKYKILIYVMTIIAIILCVPSVRYLINNKTVDGFNEYNTYTLEPWKNESIGLLSGIIVIALLLIFSILYILIIKKQKNIFKNRKEIMFFIIIISFLFMLTLPYLSSDIYYYIGDSWLLAKYGQNPYYTAVSDLQAMGINDEILNNTGCWKSTTSIYGPIWNYISTFLVKFSFGNVTVALFIFKMASLFIHFINTNLVYKITKSNKCMLLYGLNPLILIEFLSNVHNDSYLILSILLALYFLVRKKDKILTIIFLAISVAIKYSTILLVPFILIYIFRKETTLKRTIYCGISGIGIIALVVLFYMPFYLDYTVFTNMLVQNSKYSQSILLHFSLTMDRTSFDLIKSISIMGFMIFYIDSLCVILFKRKITLKELMRKYNFTMILFIFIVLTTFQKWYILWLLPTIMWQRKNMRKYIIYLTIVAIIPSIRYFIHGNDSYIYGQWYVIDTLCMSIIVMIADKVVTYFISKFRINKKEKKCLI